MGKFFGYLGGFLLLALFPPGVIYLFACWVELEWLDILGQGVGATMFRVFVGVWAIFSCGVAAVAVVAIDETASLPRG